VADRELPLQGSGSSAAVCDHEGVPRGTAARVTTRYRVQLTVPRRGGWRAWGTGSAAASSVLWPIRPTLPSLRPRSPPSTAGGADSVRVTIAMTVDSRDIADALAIARDAFTGAAADDLNGWDMTAAVAEVQPGAP
jgi:hypothetical protein